MRAYCCRHRPGPTLFAAALLVAVASLARAEGTEGHPADSAELAATAIDKHSLLPPPPAAQAIVPEVRGIDTEDTVSGSEPDPETFDRHGLEIWWRERATTLGERK
jgi:hypothetical protein